MKAKQMLMKYVLPVLLVLSLSLVTIGPRKTLWAVFLLHPVNLLVRVPIELLNKGGPSWDVKRLEQKTGLRFSPRAHLVGALVWGWEDWTLFAHVRIPPSEINELLEQTRPRTHADRQWRPCRQGWEPLWWDPCKDEFDVYVINKLPQNQALPGDPAEVQVAVPRDRGNNVPIYVYAFGY